MALWLHGTVCVSWSTHGGGDIMSLVIGVPYEARPWSRSHAATEGLVAP